MEFAWAEYKEGKDAAFFVKSMHRISIKLFSQLHGGGVKFNWCEQGGSWWYDTDARIMFIEFNGSSYIDSNSQNRRHALHYRGDGHYDLIPHDDPIYAAKIWSANSIPHMNKYYHIVMQRVHFPEVANSEHVKVTGK